MMQQQKLKLGFYPYTYARTKVMQSMLFAKGDYAKMQKMSMNEIAKLLQESHYKKEIDFFATNHSGADLIELALNRNLADTFKKLARISSDDLRKVIVEYAKRKDVEDIKTALRIKLTGDEKQAQTAFSAAGTYTLDFLMDLVKKEDVEKIIQDSGILSQAEAREASRIFGETKNLIQVENMLDKKYYSNMLKFADTLAQDALIKRFIEKEIEILDILTILRLKRAGSKGKDLENFMISKDPKIKTLIHSEEIDDFTRHMSSEYRPIFSAGIQEYKKTGSLIKLETDLYRHLLRKSMQMLHMHPLSVDVILGFMFAKEVEVRNLRILVKGKQLGLSEEFIESQLVVE